MYHFCFLFYFICSPLLSCSVIEDHWEFELLCLRPRSDGSWRNHICKTNVERYLQKMLKISAKQRIVSILPKLQLSSSHKKYWIFINTQDSVRWPCPWSVYSSPPGKLETKKVQDYFDIQWYLRTYALGYIDLQK